MSLLYETVISKLGGGINFHFKPKENSLYISPVGFLCEESFSLNLGVEINKQKLILPFGDKHKFFDYVEQDITLSTLTYRAKSYELGIVFEVVFSSSFYPKDELTSIAPFFYIDVKISKVYTKYDDGSWLEGKLIFELIPKTKTKEVEINKDILIIKDKYTAKFKINRESGLVDIIEDSSKVFYAQLLIKSLDNINFKDIKFRINKDNSFTKKFVVAMYCDDAIVIKNNSQKFYFLYNKFFKDAQEVVSFAVKKEKEIKNKIEIFDSILTKSSLSKTQQNFISYTFQSYLANTRWLYDKQTSKDIFTVIEGNCGYHSTVDVEYNVALFYLLFWPELLEKEIEIWSEFIKEDWVPHDIGALFEINGQIYPHNMEVEENCNFILLNFAYWRLTGNFNLIQKYYILLKRAIEFIIKCDKNKDGFPDERTANTVDDGSAAIQFSKEQVYLAVKTLSAAKAMQIISKEKKDFELYKKCENLIKKIKNTLDEKAWLKDHYIVCLDKKAKNLIDVWTGKKITGKLEGWDAYSIYTTNGLLYLLLCDVDVPLNLNRIKLDILNSKLNNMLEYGCTHTSKDKSNIWISQNLWQDFIGMYLGFDFSTNIERYWQFELFENTQGRGGCFVDTYGWNHLHYYPRGITSFGLLYALAGIKFDRVKKIIKFSTVKVPLEIPLVSFSDWQKGKIPFVKTFIKNNKIFYSFTNKNLLKGYKILIKNT